VPDDPEENLLFRRELIRQCNADPQLADMVLRACKRDTHFWIKTFCWLLEPREDDSPSRVPFLPWDCQSRAIDITEAAIRNKRDVLYDKSRDIGASWTVLHILYKGWAFLHDRKYALGSRIEDLVDNGDDASTLFWKLDFIYKHQPSFLKPRLRRKHCMFTNAWTNSMFQGYAFSPDFARAGRYTAIMLDEFAYPQHVGDDTEVIAATASATDTRIYVSSLDGPSGVHYELRELCRNEPPQRKPAELVELDWKDVPSRRAGLYASEKGHVIIIDKKYPFPKDYDFIPDGRIRSIYYDKYWYRVKCNKRIIAKELDRDAGKSGSVYFDTEQLDILSLGTESPTRQGRVFRNERTIRFQEDDRGPLSLWCALNERGMAPLSEYAIGADIGGGNGSSATNNSVAYVSDSRTGEQVAEYVINTERPTEFARSVFALTIMFHQPFVCWENNGSLSQIFQQELMKVLGYYNVRFHINEAKIGAKKQKLPGWFNGSKGKESIFEPWYGSLIDRKHIVRSSPVFHEARRYVNGADGKVIYRSPESDIDPSETGNAHGDRVIAAALADLAMRERPATQPAYSKIPLSMMQATSGYGSPPINAPFGSYAYCMEQNRLLALQKNNSLTKWS
jgi:hypothetical protein